MFLSSLPRNKLLNEPKITSTLTIYQIKWALDIVLSKALARSHGHTRRGISPVLEVI